jgi:hypothetical protein
VHDGGLDGVVLRQRRLDEHGAAARAATCAAGHLREQLERALAGAEVGQVHRDVGIDHADERDVREVEALRDHLRAEQDVDVAAPTRSRMSWCAHFADVVSTSMRRCAHSGTALTDLALDLLGADAAEREIVGPAFRALRRRRLLVQAVVADEQATRRDGT